MTEQEIKKYTDTAERLSAEILEVEQRTKPITHTNLKTVNKG